MRMRRKGPISLMKAKPSSIRLRMRWLTTEPGCRLVRPSAAEPRPAVLRARCGVTFMERSALAESSCVAALDVVSTDGVGATDERSEAHDALR